MKKPRKLKGALVGNAVAVAAELAVARERGVRFLTVNASTYQRWLSQPMGEFCGPLAGGKKRKLMAD